jgi:SAM-dependent methyltransferase
MMNDGIVAPRTVASPALPVLAPPARARFYDFGARLYDWLVASRVYHRWMWGMAPDEHTAFARGALASAADGPILDAGCGSALFTAECYREQSVRRHRQPLTLLDASAGMLARARRRLGSREAVWVKGDLRSLPFEAGRFANVFHFGVLHCIDEAPLVLSELARVLRPGGRLFLSCLTLARPRGDAFMRRLARSGHVAPPRHPDQVLTAVEHAGFTLRARQQRGSFLFIEAELAN